MDSTTLPTSKLDALLVVTFALAGACFGVAPRHKKMVAKYSTLLANAYSIYTAIATITEILKTTTLEKHASFLMLLLSGSSIFTSGLLIVAAIEDLHIKHCSVKIFYVVAVINLVGGYFLLYRMYSVGCENNPKLRHAALCDHSTQIVTAVMSVDAVLTLLIAAAILKKSTTNNNDERDYYEARDAPIDEEFPTVTLIMRLSAVSKASVIALFWFLVDDDMEWQGFLDYGADWWTTGQIVKHLSSVANNILNAC